MSDPQVYLPAIEGHVCSEVVRALRAFIEFCYIVRRDVHDTNTLNELQDALDRFHHYRTIFETSGVRPGGFNLPRQHSCVHYFKLIRAFGAPNGLCSLITESKHIVAIKEPWRRSNHYNALGQMLLTNQRLDKLAASRADFKACVMLTASMALPFGACINPNFFGSLAEIVICLSIDQRNYAAPSAPAPPPPMATCGDDDEDEAAVTGPRIQAHVNLAKTITHTYTF